MVTSSDYSWSGTPRWLARIIMLGNAVVLFGCGFAILDSPFNVPATVGLWLIGAVIAALAVLTPLPDK